MTSHTKYEDAREKFDDTRKPLLREIHEHELSHETVGGVRGLVEAPRKVCDDREEEVESLYQQLRLLNTSILDAEKGHEGHVERSFRKAVVGHPNQDTRARMFTVLLDLLISPTSGTWTKFIVRLCLNRPSNRAEHFRDANMPFKSAAIVELFGDEHAADIERKQYKFCTPLTESFEDVRNELHDAIRAKRIICKKLDSAEKELPYEYTDEFCQDSGPCGVINSNTDLVKSLFIEAKKARVIKFNAGDTLELQYELVEKATVEFDAFLHGLRPRSKIFAVLIDTSISATTDTWANLVRICSEGDTSTFTDQDLPMEDIKLVERNLGTEKSSQFFERQFYFCPAKLKQSFQQPVSQHLRLPLSMKKEIGEGSQGKVFRVKVVAGHFYNRQMELFPNDREFAMKQVDARGKNEWKKVEWLSKQNLHHDSIMRASASLKTDDSIFIFSDLARCNLYEFMTKDAHRASGPKDHNERLELLRSIRDIATAVRYLHLRLENDIGYRAVCYHKDLKAENILVSFRQEKSEKWIFQITDFGISSFEEKVHDREQKLCENKVYSRLSRSTRQLSTGIALGDGLPNFPPEAKHGGSVTASADIWAYGTVFAEYVSWLSGGKVSLDDFESARRLDGEQLSFQLDSAGRPVLRETIEIWFMELLRKTKDQRGEREVQLYDSCWRLLKEKLLVCDPERRVKIEEVCEKLSGILYEKSTTNIFESIRRTTQPNNERPLPATPPLEAQSQSLDLSMPENTRKRAASEDLSSEPRTDRASNGSSHVEHVERRPTNPGQQEIQYRKITHAIKSRKKQEFQKALAATKQFELDYEGSEGTVLEFAVGEGANSFALGLIHKGASVDATSQNGDSILHRAVNIDMAQVVKSLLERGADVEAKDRSGLTPLLKAVRRDMLHSGIHLLSYGANTEVQDDKMATPLLIALRRKNQDLAKELIRKGASILARDQYGWTSLHCAVRLSTTDIAKELLQRHDKLRDLENSDGHTPLHLCAKDSTDDSLKHAQLLLQMGSDVNAPGKLGRTPLNLASAENWSRTREQMVDLLFGNGADPNVDLEDNANQYPAVRKRCGRRSVLRVLSL